MQLYPITYYSFFMVEDKRKINAWIPLELYDNVVNAGYPKFTDAIIKGLELLLQDTQRIHQDMMSLRLIITGYRLFVMSYRPR